MAKYTARDVAEYYLRLVDKESGDLISHLKLQKLVYYAQGIYLTAKGKPLFNEAIVAWSHGPVVEELYHIYKPYQDGAIDSDPDYVVPEFDKETQQIFDEVYSVLGQFSAWKLRQMTHAEKPWLNANSKGSDSAITNSDMIEHFKALVTES